MTFCCPALFLLCRSAYMPQQWSIFLPDLLRERPLCSFILELQYVQMLQVQNPEQSENVSCTLGTEIHKHCVYHKLHRDACTLGHQKLSKFICSQFCCFEQHPWPNIKRQQQRKKLIFRTELQVQQKIKSVIIYSRSSCSKPHMLLFSLRNSKWENLKNSYTARFLASG